MRRVHAALKPGGRAITLEFVPNDDRISPPMAAGFSLIMLASTDSGDAYTFSQYEKMVLDAGVGKTTLHPVPEMPQQVPVYEKKETRVKEKSKQAVKRKNPAGNHEHAFGGQL